MPTNLKNLLNRSRSRNELKLRPLGEEVVDVVSCCDLNRGQETPTHDKEASCRCHQCPSPGILRKDGSCKSLFLPGLSSGSEDEDYRFHPSQGNKDCCEMRKCETVLALSSFSSISSGPENFSSSSSPSPSTSTSNKVRVMKDKILSTSSSTLNSFIHSRTTNKLFSAWKFPSSSSSSANSTSSSNLNRTGSKSKSGKKSHSQLSVLENNLGSQMNLGGDQPLTPMNRLRRNVSFTNTQSYCLLGSSKFSSISSLVAKENEEEILCRLCLCPVRAEDTVDFQACSCRYCKECVEAYVNFEIQEGAYDIACPDATCEKQGVLTLPEIERLVTPSIMGKHLKFRLYREVEKDALLMWCPTPGCETVCRIHEGEMKANGISGESPGRSSLVIKCSTCQSSYCAACKLSFHPDSSCESNRRKLTKEGKLGSSDDEDLSSIESIKKCPFCHVPIEKDSGCAQMMCKRCNHVFCWYCLASLDDDFLLRHYDKGPCKNKLGHSRASVVWHRAQVIGIFAGFGVLVLLASPLLILVAPCLLCCRCGYCANRLPDEFPASV